MYGISKQIQEKFGHQTLFKQLQKRGVSLTKPSSPPLPPLPMPPPTHNEDDLMITGEFIFSRTPYSHERETRGFSITGEALRPLLIEGKVFTTLRILLFCLTREMKEMVMVRLLRLYLFYRISIERDHF